MVMRPAILVETAALVTNHHVPVADAAAALLAAAHGGSTALQSLVGGMLASLADHSLLTNQQVIDAISGASALSNFEALGVLIGMGVNGSAAAQAASGAGILTLVLNGRLDLPIVMSTIDADGRQGMVTPGHALQVAVSIMGAANSDLDAGVTGRTGAYEKYIRDQMALEVVSLTTYAPFYRDSAIGVLIGLACDRCSRRRGRPLLCHDVGRRPDDAEPLGSNRRAADQHSVRRIGQSSDDRRRSTDAGLSPVRSAGRCRPFCPGW